jgi:ABC-type lipoprotein export system ATPase subunit
MPLLHVRNLLAGYRKSEGSGNLTILDIPEFQLESAAQVVLKGRSGCGKSTFLNVIAGLHPAESGEVLLDGTDLTRISEAERDSLRGRTIGFIFQDFHLLKGFSSLENVMLGSVFAGDPNEEPSATRKRAVKLLERVGLTHRLNHHPGMLSSGEQQRVALARALMNRPKLILADEPTGSLDEHTGSEVLKLLGELCRDQQIALILVTHDPLVMSRFENVTDFNTLNRASRETAPPQP